MRKFLAILFGKLVFFCTRYLNLGGGSAAPGLYALKIYPWLIEDLSKDIPKNIIITGTNGKTTTARMLAHILSKQGFKVLRNHTGSNLERGIASTLLSKTNLKQFDIGIWEADEAAFNKITPKIKPDIIIFLNAFRDQLDRYGEVDSVVKNWQATLKKLKNPKLIINGSDQNTAKLMQIDQNQTIFGIKEKETLGEIFGKQKNINLDIEVHDIKTYGLKGTEFLMHFGKKEISINLPIPGIYHIFDFLAVACVCTKLGIDIDTLGELIKDFKPAFGRVEKIDLDGIETFIFLIKNPVGATEVFKTIQNEIKKEDRLFLALNDNFADGTDVSWIWDAEFEQLSIHNYQYSIICSGTRAEDLALRLKYSGIEPNLIKVENNLEIGLEEAKKGLNGGLFILPTYTALLELQRVLTKKGFKEHYWRGN